MIKKQRRCLSEQIKKAEHGVTPLHKEPNQTNGAINSGNTRMKVDNKDSSVEILAYHIYQEKGGSQLDNWLEAERILADTSKAVSRLINEGNPNTQKLK